jgi:hypothetical protein
MICCEADGMKKRSRFQISGTAALVFCLAACSVLTAQSTPGNSALVPYTSCHFPDGLAIVQTDPLADGVTSREVDTDAGPRQIDMEAGVRVTFAYPDSDFYANVKVELLPTANYPQLKQYLLDNFMHIAHGNTVNTALHSPMNGLEVHGLDRDKLEGGVLGIYLLFDDTKHVVTTTYLLNQEPQARKFQTMEEYGGLRDRFLGTYSGCIRNIQQQTH